MDHLLIPSNPKHLRIEVPLRMEESYTGPFQTFPARHGWNIDSHKDTNLNEEQIEKLQCLLQTWLFFGLLEEVFGPSCATSVGSLSQSDWVRKGRNGSSVISTAPLRPLLAKLGDGNIEKAQLDHIKACLESATHAVNWLSLSNSPLINTVEVLAIAILCDAIGKSLGTDKEAYRASGRLHLGVSRYLETKMLEDGWCRNDVYRLGHQLDLPSFYLASNLDPPEQQVRHTDCTDEICRASQVDESKYITLHDTPKCDGKCRFIGASQDELATILQSGVIPLIYYDPSNEPKNFKLVPAAPGVRYVAISHVWSHGLGNQDDNSLPQCQLTRISRLVNSLPGERDQRINLFWMDTICFPLHHARAADIALVFMRKTYKEASQVLVIDRYLTATEAKPLLYTECLLRILCSSWMRRLWTLQEGVLARKLYLQFADGAIDIEYAILRMMAELTFLTHDRSLEYLPIWSMASELWEAWKSCESEEPRTILNYLAGGLRWRATSVATDEALCLATLVGLDMENIIEVPAESRMTKFWSLIPVVSAQAVFWSGQRIDSDGLRWAPSTFLGQNSAIFQDLDRKSHSEMYRDSSSSLTDSGLRLRSAGILLNTWRAPVGKDIWIRLEGQHWFHLYRPQSNVLYPKTDEEGDFCRSLVLLMKTSIDAAFFNDDPERSVTCILASVYDMDEESDIIFANIEDTTFLMRAARPPGRDSVAGLHERVAELSELQLHALDTGENGPSASQATGSSGTRNQNPGESALPMAAAGPETAHPGLEPAEAVSTKESLAAKMRRLLTADEELRTARIRARDEDGRLSVDMNGQHYIFYGAELSEGQEWCLD